MISRPRKPAWTVIFLVAGVCFFLSFLPATSLAQEGDEDPLEDPVALGAWLYGGNCVRCHGLYETERVGSSLEADELEEAIGGAGRGGCQVRWSRKKGGPFSTREIKAIVAYILAWNETEGQLSLPELPAYPTVTPFPTSTPKGQAGFVEPTSTPLPTLDPQIRLIVEGSSIAQGAWLYTGNCFRCHLAYEFSRMGTGLPSDRLKRTIANGKAGTSMPAFGVPQGGQLKVREINSIVAYILAWEKLGSQPALPEVLLIPPTPDPEALKMIPLPEIPPVQGDPDLGLVLFGENCSTCHGAEGQGAACPSLRKDWQSVRADLTIRSTIRLGAPQAGMPAWGQAAGGSLTDDQIDHLVALILAWSAIATVETLADIAAVPSSVPGMLWVILIAILSLVAAKGIKFLIEKTFKGP